MPTYETPAFVQLRANKMVGDHVEPAQHRGEVEFYSIYLGEPGSYHWVADFRYAEHALNAVDKMKLAFYCKIERSQYDAVMQIPAPEPQPKDAAEADIDPGPQYQPAEAEERAIARPYTPGVEKLIEARKLLEAGADSATVFTGTTQIVYTQDDLPALRQKILYSM